jgi:O-antigen ligase
MKLDQPTAPGRVPGRDRPARLDRSVDWLGRFVGRPGTRMTILVLPGLIAIATGVVLSIFNGGYTMTAWYSAGLFLLALLALVLATEAPRGPRLTPLLWWILAAYGSFVAFNYLSILWAGIPGDAWAGANRSLVFGLALALVLTRPWPRRAGLAALALAGFGLLAVMVGTLAVGALSDPLSQFVDGRLSEPAGYANAVACLCLMGVFPLVYLAAARIAPWPLRGLALGGATALLQIALLTQSRGSAAALVVVAILYLVLVPQRWASLLCLGVAAGLTALAWGTLTDLVHIASAARFEARLSDARAAIALSAAAATAIGAAGAFADRRLKPPSARVRRAGNWGLALVAGAVVVVTIVAIGNPVRWTERRWDDFRYSGYAKVEHGSNRFGGSLGSNRYDFYRVALHEFERHPIAGIGSENFLVPYLQQRRSNEAPHFPHSLVFRLLAQLGIVGTLAFVAFLALALTAAARTLRRARPIDAGIAVAALAAFAVWLAQGLVDWMWAFTGLGVIAFSMLAVAARSGERLSVELDAVDAGRRPGRGLGARGAIGAVATIALAVSLALPGIASRYVSSAFNAYSEGSVDVALKRLDRAAELNFLSAEPLIAKGSIARRSGQLGVAAESFAESVDREPENWFARLELGMSLVQRGRRDAAVRQIRVARRLNPRQPQVRRVLVVVRNGGSIDPTSVERALSNQLTSRLRPLPEPSG